jgi:hypothetical protein
VPDEARDLPDNHVDAFAAFALSARQERVRAALMSRQETLADLYVGGLRVLGDGSSPVAVRLAGAAMRELLDDLSRIAGVAQARGSSAAARLQTLRDRLDKPRRKVDVPEPAAGDVAGLVAVIDEFFREHDQHKGHRRRNAQQVIIGIGAAGPTASTDAVQPQVTRWMGFVTALNEILHGRRTTHDEFKQLLTAVDEFLISVLVPATFDDFTEIDRLIEEGAPDG